METLIKILVWPVGRFNEYGEFYPTALGCLLISLFSYLGGFIVAMLVVGSIITALIIVGDGPEALRVPELFRDPLCFLIDRCR
mgnify:CR=1 FL=1